MLNLEHLARAFIPAGRSDRIHRPVGAFISVTFFGSVPLQPGPMMARFPALVPVVRLPGDANTLAHANPD